MTSFVVIGRDILAAPTMAAGPYDTRDAADEIKGHLEATTTGTYYVLPLRYLRPDAEMPT